MNGTNFDENERGLLPYPVILAATKGDPDAMYKRFVRENKSPAENCRAFLLTFMIGRKKQHSKKRSHAGSA